MNCKATKIPYSETGSFSKILLDYIKGERALRSFYQYTPDIISLQEAISARMQYKINRAALFEALQSQYEHLYIDDHVKTNIALLGKEGTFTVTTAHQPNIFTGPLYFIYKILHTIKLASYYKTHFPQYDFVPVYYMGSEDADIDELGHIHLNNEKITWETAQTGAVGRMKVDKKLLSLVDRIASETGVLPHAHEIISLIRQSYKENVSIQIATLGFVNALFGKYGLVILIPDSRQLKLIATNIFEEELMRQTSASIVRKTAQRLSDIGYKPQAFVRDINLFYLQDDQRARIEKNGDRWQVSGTNISFTKEELLGVLHRHPENFSPNVILRGLFQEMILPNVSFIGGGGEIAYWLELKDMFEHYQVPYPMLVVRNSFLIINYQLNQIINKLGLKVTDIFKSVHTLQQEWVHTHASHLIAVENSLSSIEKIYHDLYVQAQGIDTTLLQHVEALKINTIKRILQLEKKFVRAEKRSHADAMQQIEKIKQQLFPNGNLQERTDNIIPYYAKWGSALIDDLYNHALSLEQEFTVLEEIGSNVKFVG